MTTMAFDSLRYARRLREAGVPEPQADVQAELMAEAFGFYADNLLTKDHFNDVLNARFAEQEAHLDAKLDARFAELDARFAAQDARFAEQDARFGSQDVRFMELDGRFIEFGARIESRFARQDSTLRLHTFMLGLITVVLVVPQLQNWFI